MVANAGDLQLSMLFELLKWGIGVLQIPKVEVKLTACK
jgi:hypothetical protein